MILALTLYACTVGEPRQCRVVNLEAPGLSAAQQAVADWCADHPGFIVNRMEARR